MSEKAGGIPAPSREGLDVPPTAGPGSHNIQTHHDGCWRDPAHHACAVAEIVRDKRFLAAFQDEQRDLKAALTTARADALEEAAKLCEGRATAPRGEDECAAYYGCSDAIRALLRRGEE